MAPVAYPPHHTPLFDALLELDLAAFERRGEVDAALAERVPDPECASFCSKGCTVPNPTNLLGVTTCPSSGATLPT